MGGGGVPNIPPAAGPPRLFVSVAIARPHVIENTRILSWCPRPRVRVQHTSTHVLERRPRKNKTTNKTNEQTVLTQEIVPCGFTQAIPSPTPNAQLPSKYSWNSVLLYMPPPPNTTPPPPAALTRGRLKAADNSDLKTRDSDNTSQ